MIIGVVQWIVNGNRHSDCSIWPIEKNQQSERPPLPSSKKQVWDEATHVVSDA
jgi:hypothetical protein